MPVSPDLIVFGVQSLITLGLAAQAAYAQHIVDKDASLPLLPDIGSDLVPAIEFFESDANRAWIAEGGPLAAHWDRGLNRPRQGALHSDAVVMAWHRLQAQQPGAMPGAIAAAGVMLVRQWAEQDPSRPPSPRLRIVLALADVALDFAKVSPALLASTGASQPLLRAIAALATETTAIIPPLDDPEAWKGDKWRGANFGQSLLLTAFRVGLATLANHPDLVVDDTHVQRLVSATILPLKNGFDAEAAKDGATSASVLVALTRWERLRDQVLPGMVAAALRSVAADRNAFLGAVVHPAGGRRLDLLVAGIANGVLDEVATLDDDDLLQRETWFGFFRASVSVVASRPELVVAGQGDAQQAEALRGLVKSVATSLAADAAVGKVGRVVLLDVATTALDSVRTSLPMLLGGEGSWDAIARTLATGVIDAIRPAVAGGDPALLKRLASREQVAQLVATVLRQVIATPSLAIGPRASGDARAVLAAVAGAMAADGAALLHPEGWLAVAAAAAGAAAGNPGRLFRVAGGEAAIGARLIGLALAQASAGLAAAGEGEVPVLAGVVLQDTVTALLGLATRKRMSLPQADVLAAVLGRLAAEAHRADGLLLPSQIAVVLAGAGAAFLDGKAALDGAMPVAAIIALAMAGPG